jgi:hypothetical protein
MGVESKITGRSRGQARWRKQLIKHEAPPVDQSRAGLNLLFAVTASFDRHHHDRGVVLEGLAPAVGQLLLDGHRGRRGCGIVRALE